jgi:fibronectin type 3 domain-containing protein
MNKILQFVKRQQLLVLAVLFLSFPGLSRVEAQSARQSIADPGTKGIFVYLGHDIPIHKITSYRIDRKTTGKAAWKRIALIKGPNTQKQFSIQLLKAEALLPDLPAPDSTRIQWIWQRAKKHAILDSVEYWGTLPSIRIALGAMYLDSTAHPHVRYQYRVTALKGKSKVGSPVISIPASYPGKTNFALMRTYKTQSNARQNFIQWYTPNKSRTEPKLFRVYRQDGLKSPFHPIQPKSGFYSNTDTLFMVAFDTLVTPLKIYRYYALPVDLYGNVGSPSDTILVGTYNFSTITIPLRFSVHSSDSLGGLLLKWKLARPGLITALSIYRSASYDTGYVHLADIEPTDSIYVDQTVVPMKKYYYYLVMNGPLGEVSAPTVRAFGFFQNNIPSFPPSIKGEPVSNGVRIQWTTAQSDIDGYRVYRSNGVGNTLSPISTLLTAADSLNSFIDSSRTLKGNITYAYAIRSENVSHQQSAFSDTIYVRPGIKTTPPVPLNLRGYGDHTYVQLYWKDMQPFDQALGGYQILRREVKPKKQRSFKAVNDSLIPAEQNHYADSTVIMGKTYEYAIQSQDIFGSKSRATTSFVIDLPLSRPIPPGHVFVEQQGKSVIIRWNRTDQPDVKEYHVYRYRRGHPAKRIGSVRSNKPLEIKDSTVQTGKLYFYYCTSVSRNGLESKPGGESSIRPGV